MEEKKIKLELKYKDLQDNNYGMSSEVTIYPDIGTAEQNEIAIIINTFMRQIGYLQYDKTMVFLESVTEEEYEYLLTMLENYRTRVDDVEQEKN